MIYDEENFPELPLGWISIGVEDAVESVGNSNKKLKSKDALSQGRFPVIDQGQDNISGYSDDESLVVDASELKPVILFGDHTRILKQIFRPFVPGADGTKLFKAKEYWDTRFVYQMLRAIKLPDKGYARHYQYLRNSTLPLPPLPEQKRIADKLDTVLARVDACRERLNRVPLILKRFKQSVLAAATSGKLTEDWRRENSAVFESLTKKTQTNIFANQDTIYPTVKLSEIAISRLGKMLDKTKNSGTLRPYLGNINVRWFDFEMDNLQKIRVEEKEIEGLTLRKGDVLICEGGEPGRCAIWNRNDSNIIFQKALHRVRTDNEKLLPQWLVHCIKFSADSKQLDDLFTGTTIKHLTGVALAKFELPVPPIEEQQEIVRRVETLFAFADRLEARLAKARNATERLTPGLLAKAFRGELVEQDPNDEPAIELLNRLESALTKKRTEATRCN